jgi:hypothetical protein
MSLSEVTLVPVMRALFRKSKYWYAAALVGKLVVSLMGLIYLYSAMSRVTEPILAFILYIASELAVWRSEKFRNLAEAALRRLEHSNSFGWKFSGVEYISLLINASAATQTSPEPYYASTAAPGATRALDNVLESAWWSQQLSASLRTCCLMVAAILATLAISGLWLGVAGEPQGVSREVLSVLVSSLLGLLPAADLLRLSRNFGEFGDVSRGVVDHAESLSHSKDLRDQDVLMLLHEYQVARSNAPLIPEWLWKMKRGTLNKLWDTYIVGKSQLDEVAV